MEFIIDIDMDKVFTDGQNNKLYRAKGFNSLVFDEEGLKRLEKNDDPKRIKREKKICDESLEAGYKSGFNEGITEFAELYLYESDFKPFLNTIDEDITLYGAISIYGEDEVIKRFGEWKKECKRLENHNFIVNQLRNMIDEYGDAAVKTAFEEF